MAGKKCDVRILRPMRHRNPGVSRPGNGRSNPRHNLKLNSNIDNGLGFFRAAPKNKRIAAFQPHNLFSFPRFLDQECVDLLLAQRVFARFFPSIDYLRVIPRPAEHLRICQMIVNDHVGPLHALFGTQRDKT